MIPPIEIYISIFFFVRTTFRIRKAFFMFPSPVLSLPDTAVKVLEAANFELHAKLEKTTQELKLIQKEKVELLDRLEKALFIAAKLKDAEKDNIELREKLAMSEQELRVLFMQRNEFQKSDQDKSKLLTQVREKYFTERTRSDELSGEVERVKTVADLAKREIDNQINNVHLRETQLNILRRDALVHDELDMARPSRGNGADERGMHNSWKDWQLTPLLSQEPRVSENVRRILTSGVSDYGGTLFEDKSIRVTVSVKIFQQSVAHINVLVTNISPGIIQGVRILNSTRSNSNFEFIFSPSNESFLKPGQHTCANAEFKLIHPSFNVSPTICVSYTPSGDLPSNHYISLPIAVAKFCLPTRSSLDKWSSREFVESEQSCRFTVAREELKFFTSVVSLAEFGGSFTPQRAMDPNPRGQILAACLDMSNQATDVFVRVELSPADQRGPLQCRVTVRSPQAVLSKAVMSNILDVLI